MSCSNDVQTIKLVSKKNTLPDVYAEKISYVYSDSAVVKINVTAPQVKSFSNPEKPYTVFPKGILVVYFTKYPDTSSMISADYAIRHTNEKRWEAKGNVVVKNTKGEVLNTEYLVWDDRKAIIYSNQYVKIKTGDDIVEGEGFQADQNFEKWVIKKAKGEVTLANQNDSIIGQ